MPHVNYFLAFKNQTLFFISLFIARGAFVKAERPKGRASRGRRHAKARAGPRAQAAAHAIARVPPSFFIFISLGA